MNKTRWYILGDIFLCLMVGITMVSIKPAMAETSETTFPVGEAGIAAYVKVNSIDITDLADALYLYNSVEKYDKTYAIGTLSVESGLPGFGSILYDYPHLYIGLDGWLVAYYLKTEEASRIMQWKGYAAGAINTTILQDAIDTMCTELGVTYSEPVKYYDFEFPEANRLTIIAETIVYSDNSFFITIPGTLTLYEASYSVYTKGPHCTGMWGESCTVYPSILSVDENTVFSSPASYWTRYYGYYDITTQLKVDEPHIINFSRPGGGGAATVLIHKTY